MDIFLIVCAKQAYRSLRWESKLQHHFHCCGFACSVSAQTIKAADVHPEGYPNVVAVQHMGEKLKQQTDGKLEIKVFPGGVLGDEKQMIEQAQMGRST